MASETAKRDDNYVTTLMGVDMTSGLLPTKVYVDETTHRLLVSAVITSDSSVLPTTSSVTLVGDETTSTELLAANSSRKEVIITNNSTAILFLKFGTGASASSWTARLFQYGTVETDYKGVIHGVWSSNPGGNAQVTELT